MAHMAGIPLDRSRPLWEMCVIEGLRAGKVAVFTKMHHATVDGVSGVNMISVLCSLEPDARRSSLGPPPEPSGHLPSDLSCSRRGVLSQPG